MDFEVTLAFGWVDLLSKQTCAGPEQKWKCANVTWKVCRQTVIWFFEKLCHFHLVIHDFSHPCESSRFFLSCVKDTRQPGPTRGLVRFCLGYAFWEAKHFFLDWNLGERRILATNNTLIWILISVATCRLELNMLEFTMWWGRASTFNWLSLSWGKTLSRQNCELQKPKHHTINLDK